MLECFDEIHERAEILDNIFAAGRLSLVAGKGKFQ